VGGALFKQHHLTLTATTSACHNERWLGQENKGSKRFLAIKTINKKSIVEAKGDDLQRKVQRLLNERQILQHLDHPFVVHLLYFFQDEQRVYFGISLAGCNDFFTILNEMNSATGLGMVACRFYAAEVRRVG